jgi:hypothetical protein
MRSKMIVGNVAHDAAKPRIAFAFPVTDFQLRAPQVRGRGV